MKIICQSCGAITASEVENCEICGLPVLSALSDATLPPMAEGIGTTTELSGTDTKQADTEDETAPSTVTIASTRFMQKTPLHIGVHFASALVAGHPGSMVLQLRNLTSTPLKHIRLTLSSRGLKSPVTFEIESAAPQQPTNHTVQVEAERAGTFILWCEAHLRVRDQSQLLTARRPIAINTKPAEAGSSIDLRDIHTNHGLGEDTLAAQAFRNAPLNTFADAAGIRTLNDLLAFRFPERFQPLALVEDWHLPVPLVNTLSQPQSRKLVIPRQFRRYSQSGRLLKLTPPDENACNAVHIVARDQFTIGRSRRRADLITWFFPLTPANDDKTQHLSKIHLVGKCIDGDLFLQDSESKCGTYWDGEKMPPLDWLPLTRRSLLALADEYFLDIQPLESACLNGPEIINITLWPGPGDTSRPKHKGAVRFAPIEMDLAHHSAVWMFTDLTFGRSRFNAVVLPFEGIEPVQGRIHFYRDCFWLENLVANFSVRVNGIAVGSREIVPLMDGLDLKIGDVNFRVDVLP